MNIIEHIKVYIYTFLKNCGAFSESITNCNDIQCKTDAFFQHFTPYLVDLALFFTYLMILWAILACIRSAISHMVNNPKTITGTIVPSFIITLIFVICIGVSSSQMPNEYIEALPTLNHIKKLNKEGNQLTHACIKKLDKSAKNWNEYSPEWNIAGKNRYEEFKGKYGQALQKYEPEIFGSNMPEWNIAGENRYEEFKGKYGQAMRKYSKNEFKSGIKELSSFDKFIEPFINAKAPAVAYNKITAKNPPLKSTALKTQISGGALITFYILSLITICIILYSTIVTKLFSR